MGWFSELIGEMIGYLDRSVVIQFLVCVCVFFLPIVVYSFLLDRCFHLNFPVFGEDDLSGSSLARLLSLSLRAAVNQVQEKRKVGNIYLQWI